MAPMFPAEQLLPNYLPRVAGDHPMVLDCGTEVVPLRAGVFRDGRRIGVLAVKSGHEGVPLVPTGTSRLEEG